MRILLVKTSSLGDVVHQCPAVSDIARHYPAAHIDWVVEEAFADIARMHRDISEVIPVALRRWRKTPLRSSVWREIRAFRRRMARERYDLVIDSQGLIKSALIARLARGPRHGLDSTSAREPLASRFYDFVHRVPRELHPVARNRLLAAAVLGGEPGSLIDYGLSAGTVPARDGPYVVLLSMTSRPEKLWPTERWTALARALVGRGFRVILPHGTPEERRRSEAIVAGSPDGEVPPHMQVPELAALMKGARAVIGLDTGLLHLAAGLGVPAVGIYGGTDPARFGLYPGSDAAGRTRDVGSPAAMPATEEVLGAFGEVDCA